MTKPLSGRVSRGGANRVSTAQSSAEKESTVRGVPQSVIDNLRGTRGHMAPGEQTSDVIQQDYAKVGINISAQEAQRIYDDLRDYTLDGFAFIREAWLKQQRGETLTSQEQNYLKGYSLINEYTHIAPTMKINANDQVYRGISNDNLSYSKKLSALKSGDTFDLDRPSSFSTKAMVAEMYADWGNLIGGIQGFILHINGKDLHHSPSISGLSYYISEDEVLVNDRMWRVKATNMDTYNHKHIYLEKI